MKAYFYDIESLANVFTLCNFKADENHADVYFLIDNPVLYSSPDFERNAAKRIRERNRNFDGTISFHNLRYEFANETLAKTFGLSDATLINDASSKSNYPEKFRLVCDTDENYDPEKYPYFFGYNSFNYDTTMLAMYYHEVWSIKQDGRCVFEPTKASLMRAYNDELFIDKFKKQMPTRLLYTFNNRTRAWEGPDYSDTRNRIHKNLMMSGRHVDVARLNEKQQKVALKRLLGMLGYQILESDKLNTKSNIIENEDQLYDLIAYNMSDVINLKCLFEHPVYTSQFKLKRKLLKTYQEVVYDKLGNQYKPNVNPKAVRKDRLRIDSSSAQFAIKSLCPYEHLTDIPVVSFMYPSERRAKELGVKRVNVLEECRKFFYNNFPQPEIRARFDAIYNYYKAIEGNNYNDSKFYEEDYKNTPEYKNPISIDCIPKTNDCLPYFNADGTPSSCFVKFSYGGIHGAEYNKELFEYDLEEYKKVVEDMEYVKSLYPDPIDCKKAKKIIMPDGTERKSTDFLKSGSTNKASFYKEINKKEPKLFVPLEKGGSKLNEKYAYTSAALTNHEDFTSYYPMLLRMLDAFLNHGLGYDRYNEIFFDKEKFGKLMKDKSYSDEERAEFETSRGGVKLLLNSASGAGDAKYDNNIHISNTIISMRIIGQLFTWRIGQAQTIQGAKIPSTNTDGLYSILEAEFNNKILAKEAADINVGIEPEPIYLISKDTNNRLEMNPDTGKIISASGGTLGCRRGPDPTKSLNHPAVIDWAMAEYLVVAALHHKNLSIDKPFDDETGLNILKSVTKKFEPVEALKMFQNIVASSTGSIRYIFATKKDNPANPIILQHYNRVFIMKDDYENGVHLRSANSKKITPSMIKKRKRDNERPQQHDPIAMQILNAYGVDKIDGGSEAKIEKITDIEPEWNMLIENNDLHMMSDEKIKDILDNLDYDKYLAILRGKYEKNWRNHMPGDTLDDETEQASA